MYAPNQTGWAIKPSLRKIVYIKKNSLFVLIIVLLVALSKSSAVMSKTLDIVTIEVEPFGFYTSDNKPTGMMYEIGNLIAKEAGLTFRNKIIPYARTSSYVINGEADFVIRYTNEQLKRDSILVVSAISMQNIVVGLRGSEYQSLTDLHGKTVANIRGAIFDEEFSADQKILKFDVNDYRQGLKMMFGRRNISSVIGSNVGIYYTASILGYLPEQLGKLLHLSSQSFWLHFSKKNADQKIIIALKAATERLKKQGSIRNIISKYVGSFRNYIRPNMRLKPPSLDE